ncbi:hypothetical protein PF005_g1630 [Phytophthora fragariae]|uniref:Calponin-homology (CH) domain-containing protein n=1 Tax=Phytophthora fragariae TaxID=53985 RepID=A0A6A3ZHH8_9STRA|nr:hypothetical protein PF007_g1785 [Phytophthora fragariae]KAE9235053.1 hypothetical protein PF005_g1630 [Phytophthora fragariae]
MADLLLRWLNHELELSTHVTHVEADFASGYLLGEILHRLNHQHDFADFMRSSSADAKILNFCLLEPTLRNLNIKFDANVAAAIMNEKKDAAANLLYQIKIAATRVGRAPTVSSKSLERTGVVPLHNRPVKLAKPSYDSENHRLFEHSVRRHVRSIASLQQEKDRIAEEATKRKAYLARMAEQKEILEATKAERLHRAYIHSSFIKEALEETDSPAWRLALQKKNAREQRRAAFFQQLMKKREEEEENITFSLRRKVQNDLDDFNSNGDSKSSTAGGRVSSRKSVGYGLRSLTTALGAASDRKKYSTSNLAGSSINERELYHANMLEMESARGVIKQQMLQREKRKEKLSRRRKRFVQECVYTNTRTGTARVASILENVVLRDTNSEKDVQEGGSNKAGWLIFDLPATEQHSQHLEEQLTGYVDPAFVPSPSDFASAIAPGLNKPALSPTFLHGKSGVDLVFHIDCAVGTVLDRCLGKLEDCATGDKQHLVFDPPPDDSIVRHRLQHVNPSAFSSELLSLHCLANEEFSRDHKTWYTKFKTLHELSSRGMTVNEIHEAITAIVNQLQKDRQDETESQQLQMETMEQELMTSEEERQRRINSFEANIEEAKGGIAKVEASVAEAEEAKAKKEEILELRQKLEEAQHQLDSVVACVKSWVEEEQAQRPVPSSKYSGELVPETAHALAALWNNAETEYISTMKTSFSLLREQRHRATERAQLMTSEFCEFVRRPDQKQEIVNLFQKQFNDVVEEMRFDDLTKVELHARVDMLQDELGALIDTKIAANDEELSSMVGDGWTEDNCQQVAAIYQMALQAECDRFRISIQILVDGHSTASSERSQLSSIVETWQAHQSRLEMACRIYRDPANDTPVETPIALSTSAAAGKPPPKGKVKAPTPAAAAAPSTTAISEDAQAEVLSMPELLAEYTHVLQRCASWMDAITAIANAEEDDAANREHNGDYCKINLLNGIRYEHDLMQRRVRFLQEATEKSCDEITRSMRSIEITLRGVLEGRKDREQVAVADLVAYIRAAIEAEVAIPSFIDVSSEFIERFPTTVQLREDTAVRVDGDRRLLPRIPPEALPIVEEAHELRLNARQRDGLREALTSQTCDDSGLLPLCTLVEIIAALTSQPDALPEVWRRCPAHVIAQVAAGFTMKQSAFVDIEALLTAMSIRDDLLRQFQQDEAREELERQQQLELQHQQEEHERALFLQQQQDSQDSESAPAGTVE